MLGISQSPAYNFNKDKIKKGSDLKVLPVESVFEPGSIMKPIVAAYAIDKGFVHATDLINCEHGKYKFANHYINDTHPSDIISVHDVIVRSSNIGMTKIAEKIGKENLYNGIKSFGFGNLSGISLPGETEGIFRSVNTWSDIDIATHSYGQGIAVTPLQIVSAIGAIANGGILNSLSIVKSSGKKNGLENKPSKRIISEKNCSSSSKHDGRGCRRRKRHWYYGNDSRSYNWWEDRNCSKTKYSWQRVFTGKVFLIFCWFC